MTHSLVSSILVDSPWIVGITFVFLLLTVLSLRKHGTLYRQFQLAFDTRNIRTFSEQQSGNENIVKILLLLQTFIFEGFCLFLSVNTSAHYNFSLNVETLINLSFCCALPIGWYLFQLVCFNIFGYLFGNGSALLIINRAFQAITYTSGVFFLLLFMSQLVIRFDSNLTMILLTILFFITQLLFIFNGIKIFFNGIVTLCFLILYLCTLEIAPLYVLFHKVVF